MVEQKTSTAQPILIIPLAAREGIWGHGDREPFPGCLSQLGPTSLPANP